MVKLSGEGWLIMVGRAVRSFSFGWLSVILVLYLQLRGLGVPAIGAILTATMVEDALLTMLLSAVAARLGPARVMAATAPLIAVGGVLLAVADQPCHLARSVNSFGGTRNKRTGPVRSKLLATMYTQPVGESGVGIGS